MENKDWEDVCLPYHSLREDIKDYIGKSFETRKGNTLTVKGVIPSDRNGCLYAVECSICSKDKELFPTGKIVSTRYGLNHKNNPCACSGSYYYDNDQLEIITRRLCKDLKLELINFDFGGSVRTTKIIVKDTVYSNIISDEITLPVFKLAGRRVIEKFLKFEDLTNYSDNIPYRVHMEGVRYFFRDPYSGNFYLYCKLCGKDEFTLNGVGGSIFPTTIKSLVKGYLPCRCSERPRLNEEQVTYLLNKTLSEEGCKFIRYCGENSRSYQSWRFSWECRCGHKNKNVLVGNYLNGKRRCSACAKSGFDVTKPTFFYIVRWYNEEGFSCLKFGITNRKSVLDRVSQQNRLSPLTFEIISYYRFDTGYHPLSVETYLKRNCRDIKYCPKELLPSGWNETITDTLDNICFIENLVLQG